MLLQTLPLSAAVETQSGYHNGALQCSFALMQLCGCFIAGQYTG
jgi:hypothetical protein